MPRYSLVLGSLLSALLLVGCGSAIEVASSYNEEPEQSATSQPLGQFEFSFDVGAGSVTVSKVSASQQLFNSLVPGSASNQLGLSFSDGVTITTDPARTAAQAGCGLATSGIRVTIPSKTYENVRLTRTVTYPSDTVLQAVSYDSGKEVIEFGDSGNGTIDYASMRGGTPSCSNFTMGFALSGDQVDSYEKDHLSIVQLEYEDIPTWGARDESTTPILEVTTPSVAGGPVPSPLNPLPAGEEDRLLVHVRGDLTEEPTIYYSIGGSSLYPATLEDPGDGETAVLSINGDPLADDASLDTGMPLRFHTDDGTPISDDYWFGNWSSTFLQFKAPPCPGLLYHGLLLVYWAADLQENPTGTLIPKKGSENNFGGAQGFGLLETGVLENVSWTLPSVINPGNSYVVMTFADCNADRVIDNVNDFVISTVQMPYSIEGGMNRVILAAGEWVAYAGDPIDYDP